MKKYKYLLLLLTFLISSPAFSQSWIRINQLGYLPKSIKEAVLISKENISLTNFELRDALTGKTVFTSKKITSFGKYDPFLSTFRLNFSEFKNSGAYYIFADGTKSPNFRIDKNVYDGTADFLLKYMREQRCGYNPFLKDSCHTHDGFVIYNTLLDSAHIDVTGGWHDATDYLQYATTSANATFQMLFAYQQNPESFGDEFDKDGNPGANGIPDILDEVKWGLDWLVKMNPKKGMMFNQIADDRDHVGFRLPTNDSAYYGKGLERPVYFVSGEPQGVFKYQNRTTGVSSTAGKFSSAFALGSEILQKYYPEFADELKQKAVNAFEFGEEKPGVCQTAPAGSPYFYEEDNYVDDMELAAVQLNLMTGKKEYLQKSVEYGSKEPVTPWMGADTARHYQWYPFINLGHYYLAESENSEIKNLFISNLEKGIEGVYERGKSNPFQIGIPFIWCSNNLAAAILTQCRLYTSLTKDSTYAEMEAAVRDWLFGCNLWGTSMIIGLPKDGETPDDPHSSLTHLYNYKINGGLVDGPVYATIFNNLKGLKIYNGDEFSQFQSNKVVYHDDYGDYSTNEPTMDGTASLTYYLSALQKEGNNEASVDTNKDYNLGAIIRTDKNQKNISLVFTGHEFAEGFDVVNNVLKKHQIKASFFLTGDFYRNEKFKNLINTLREEGCYLGAHSDKHLLYASWEKRDSTLITKDEFVNDLQKNYAEMAKFGITKNDAKYFLPPYEWHNNQINEWCKEIGLTLVNFTPGTNSNQDWTYPALDKKYFDSDKIYGNIINFEKTDKNGLNGFILLTHMGTDVRREDKFYNRLDELVTELENKGYTFTTIDEAMK